MSADQMTVEEARKLRIRDYSLEIMKGLAPRLCEHLVDAPYRSAGPNLKNLERLHKKAAELSVGLATTLDIALTREEKSREKREKKGKSKG